MTVKEWKEMNELYERVHELKKELAKAWTADELFRMLDCMKAPYVDKQNTNLFSQGVREGYLRACSNIRYIVAIRKEN